MNKLVFKSNTEGKLKKLLNGSIFSSKTTFITEFFQNSQRANAKNINITQKDNTFIFEDDGIGLKNPQGLMTFDYSEWESTDEGFGIGFWSVLAIEGLEKLIIESNKYLITCDVNLLKDIINGNSSSMLDDVLSLESLNTSQKGFKITLISDFFNENLINEVEECCKYLNFNVHFNEFLLERADLFDEVDGEFIQEYNTRLFSAKLSVTDVYTYPEVYYENRKVCDLYKFPYVKGIIKLKAKAVTLREPDRTDIINDEKRYFFIQRVENVIIQLYRDFLWYAVEFNLLDTYEDSIINYLKVSDFEKYLKIDDIDIVEEVKEDDLESSLKKFSLNYKEEIEDDVKDELERESDNNYDYNTSEVASDVSNDISYENSSILKNSSDNNISIHTSQDNEATSSTKLSDDNVKEDKNAIFNTNGYINENETETTKITKNVLGNDGNYVSPPNKSLKDFIKKNKDVVWVEARNREYYKENIALAEYYGIKVLIAKNLLLERFFQAKGIDYITSLKEKVVIERVYKDITTKTDKEITFLKILEPIRKALNLPEGFFKIANISKITTINLNNKCKVLKEKSSGDKISVYAVSSSNEIIFDRTAIALKRFNLSSSKNVSIGKNELKCLMYNMDTIAHELAHVLYNTTDNTKEHFFVQSKIQEELVKLYIKY